MRVSADRLLKDLYRAVNHPQDFRILNSGRRTAEAEWRLEGDGHPAPYAVLRLRVAVEGEGITIVAERILSEVTAANRRNMKITDLPYWAWLSENDADETTWNVKPNRKILAAAQHLIVDRVKKSLDLMRLYLAAQKVG